MWIPVLVGGALGGAIGFFLPHQLARKAQWRCTTSRGFSVVPPVSPAQLATNDAALASCHRDQVVIDVIGDISPLKGAGLLAATGAGVAWGLTRK